MVAVSPVLLATYGYRSADTRTPRARAASTSAITSLIRPKLRWPVTFRWKTCTGIFAALADRDRLFDSFTQLQAVVPEV